MERILCAAIWYKELNRLNPKWEKTVGYTWPKNVHHGIVLCGYRHPSCMYQMVAITGKRSVEVECGKYIQGFLTSQNRFVNRREAMTIAIAAGQVEDIPYYRNRALYSEDLY